MTFKAYDIFSSLVPGFIMLLGLLYFLNIPYDKDFVIGYTALAFLLGYVLNTIGSWLEHFYFFTWGGKPSSQLLSGKKVWKIRVYNHVQIHQHLSQKTTNANATNDELFSIAMRNVNGQKDSRIEDFNAIYAFSRTLLTTVIIGSILIMTKNYSDWKYYAVLIPIILTLWLRCKQRGYYYAKEVLNVYCKINNI
ncbi:hypothetical protein [Lacibacter luteus]|uniref:hypothetical protein n=1 Tax=Lacibacter luteus TaxID=2508719 RepID=UPI00197B0ADC|nr:hypothetical protein [Lacibacter luteus]